MSQAATLEKIRDPRPRISENTGYENEGVMKYTSLSGA
jgi:hypothetical protein